MAVYLPPEIDTIILSYLCPFETSGAVHVLNTNFKNSFTNFENSLANWIVSLQVTTQDISFKGLVTRVNGKIHRSDNDKPAIESSNGFAWYYNGKLHRVSDKPAVITSDGSKVWYYNGEIRRDGGRPTIEFSNGLKSWSFK